MRTFPIPPEVNPRLQNGASQVSHAFPGPGMPPPALITHTATWQYNFPLGAPILAYEIF